MMILDRYLLRQYVQIFVICFVSMMGLYIVIDAFGHLDQFSSYAKENGNLLAIIGEYYAYRSLSFFDRAGGILAMIAAIFTATWLQRHEELTAMLAAGISKFRVIKPLIFATIAVSLLGVANREFIIPTVRDELARDTNDLGGTESRDLEPRFDGRTDILISGQKTIAKEQRILEPTFILPSRLAQYDKQLVAENAYYQPATAEHPAGYLLDKVSTPKGIDNLASLQLDNEPIVITSRDAPWLKPGQVFVVSQVSFQILASGSTWRHYASTGELITELSRPSSELGADVRVAVHARLTQPVMDATLLMLGLPLMFSRRNRNVFLSIGLCLLVVVAFSIVTLACQSLGGLNLLRPTLAAWLPILIFLPIAAAMSQSLRT
ncbi:MAG: LptF/LptG family permease [Planctomycetes bacterium]|nr:LptF/LptG family permease [Planctomycetota bacterium]